MGDNRCVTWSNLIDTVFHFDATPVRVSHEQCSDPIGRADDGLLIRSNDAAPDVLTSIVIGPHGDAAHVYVFWSKVTAADSFDLLYVPRSQTLFVGGGTVSATVSLGSMSLVNQNEITLFWTFERRRDYVLELGELDCFLYDLEGNLISTVPADPPYEINDTDGGINIVSIVAGSQWLEYPT